MRKAPLRSEPKKSFLVEQFQLESCTRGKRYEMGFLCGRHALIADAAVPSIVVDGLVFKKHPKILVQNGGPSRATANPKVP